MSATHTPDPLLDFPAEDEIDESRPVWTPPAAPWETESAHRHDAAPSPSRRLDWRQWGGAAVVGAAVVAAVTVTATRIGRSSVRPVAAPSAASDIALPALDRRAAVPARPTPVAPPRVEKAASKAARPAPPAPVGTSGGWLTVASPVDFEIHENGQLLGTTAIPRLMLPVGKHRVEIGSAPLGYQESRTVDVQPGRSTEVKVSAPNGRLNINASPWATVAIDGREVGQTPLANVALPIGPHEVVFRHPVLGERRQTVVVTLRGVARVGVDLSR